MRRSFATALIVCVAFLCVGVDFIHAKNEIELWTGMSLDYTPSKNLKFYLEGEFRFDENITREKYKFTEVGARYRFGKLAAVRINYRLSDYPDEIRQRVDANIYLNLKLNSAKLSNRARAQMEFIGGEDSVMVFRDRVRIRFKISKVFDTYFGGEIFIGLSEEGKNEDKLRFSCGVDWEALKKVTFRVFYHFQTELSVDEPDSSHILGLRLKFSI